MKTNFKNANGDLSRYALACGYVQKREVSPGIEVSLWRVSRSSARLREWSTGFLAFRKAYGMSEDLP